jgi:hypothetical protein
VLSLPTLRSCDPYLDTGSRFIHQKELFMTGLRKVQLLALAVIANGVVALAAMSPQEAQAAACSPTTFCATTFACTFMEYACPPPSGCEFVGGTCGAQCASWPITRQMLTCNFAPL